MEQFLEVLNQIWALILSFKDLSAREQVLGIVFTLVNLWKSSMLKPYWDKLGEYKVWVAPALSLLVGWFIIPEISLNAVWDSLTGGMLAVALHHLMTTAQTIPKLGDKYLAMVNFFEKILRKPLEEAVEKGIDPLNPPK